MSTQIEKNKRKLIIAKDERYGICGATKVDGGICSQNAGQETNHPGEGRCYWHESLSGSSPVEMYKIPALEDRMAFFQKDKDIYSLDREIALNRAYLELFDKHIKIFSEFTPDELTEMGLKLDASELTRSITTLTKTIAKLIETKHNIEVGRKYVVDIKVVQVIMSLIGEAIDKTVTDVEQREEINMSLNRIALPVAQV